MNPSAGTDAFEALARRLDELAHAVVALTTAPTTWMPGSPAAAEIAADTFAGAWAAKPVREVLLLPVPLLTHTADHLGGMAAVVRAPGVVMSALSLMRPALVSAGLAYYLLEPDVEVRERVRRGMNLMLASYVEQLTLARSPGGKAEFHFRQRIVWTLMGARRHGFEFNTARRAPALGVEKARWLDTPLPSDQRLISQLLDDVPGEIGPLLHRITSAIVHGQIHGFQLFIGQHLEASSEPGTHMTEIGMSLGDFARWSGGVVYGLHRLMLRACKHYGWDTTQWDAAAQPALADWRRWIELPGLPRGPRP